MRCPSHVSSLALAEEKIFVECLNHQGLQSKYPEVAAARRTANFDGQHSLWDLEKTMRVVGEIALSLATKANVERCQAGSDNRSVDTLIRE
jgi:hypothetical protein